MSPLVLRRKLQKKKKHNPYGACPRCGDRTERFVSRHPDGWRLSGRCNRCRAVVEELTWTGKPG